MESKKFKALDIANYIVHYANKTLNSKVLTPIKLQKILYYVYVNCLVKQNYKLFDEPIEKWKFGPVVSSVYHDFKTYGTAHIDTPVDSFEFTDYSNGGFSFQMLPFNHEEIEKQPFINEIESTISDLIDTPAFTLVERTHQEDPWKNFEKQILSGSKGLVYSDQEIKNFFKL